MRKVLMAMLVAAAWLPLKEAAAAKVGSLLGDAVHNLEGVKLGEVGDFIVDVRVGRVLYVIVEGTGRSYTLPIRALDERMRIDMDLSNSLARDKSQQDPKFRRAGRLIGQPVTNPGDGRVGTIADIEFHFQSGEVEQVEVQTPEGERSLPPSVLAHGRFPPLTQWQVENPPAEVSGEQGFVRREPSDERKRLHNPQW